MTRPEKTGGKARAALLPATSRPDKKTVRRPKVFTGLRRRVAVFQSGLMRPHSKKERLLSFFYALLILGSAGCVTFRPAAEAAGPEVEEFLVCLGVAQSGELLAPQGAGAAFGPNIESVYAFVRLRDVGRDIRLRWKWYAPDGSLVRDSGPVAVRTDGRRLDEVTAFDRLDLPPGRGARSPGSWTAVVFLEEEAASVRTFLLKAGS